MVDTGIFTTNAKVLMKAGLSASAISGAEAYTNEYISLAESVINSTVRYNFSDNYALLNTDTKCILSDIASSIAAIYVIMYDMSNYSTRVEAEDIINILYDSYNKSLTILKDKKVQDFINDS
jgi:hypothetical protein